MIIIVYIRLLIFFRYLMRIPKKLSSIVVIFCMTFYATEYLSAKDPNSLDNAWELFVQLRFNDAFDYLSNNFEDDVELLGEPFVRNIHLGQALSILNKNPKTTANTRRAVSMLHTIVKENPVDETGLMARYILARVYLFHQTPVRQNDAIIQYEGIINDKPEHLIAQICVIKLSMLQIYGENRGETRLEVIKSIEAKAPLLTDSALVRDYHLLLGNAYMYFNLSSEKALQHLIKADRIGIVGPISASEIYLQIAELANSIGNYRIANSYYKSFIQKYPRDIRTYTVMQRIAELSNIPNFDQ